MLVAFGEQIPNNSPEVRDPAAFNCTKVEDTELSKLFLCIYCWKMVCKENTQPVPSKTTSMFVHVIIFKIHTDKHSVTPAKSPGFFHTTTISSCQAVTSIANKWSCQTQNKKIIGQMCYRGTSRQHSELSHPTQGNNWQLWSRFSTAHFSHQQSLPIWSSSGALHQCKWKDQHGGPLPTHTEQQGEPWEAPPLQGPREWLCLTPEDQWATWGMHQKSFSTLQSL